MRRPSGRAAASTAGTAGAGAGGLAAPQDRAWWACRRAGGTMCSTHAARTLGRWIVEDALYATAERNGLVGDPRDGPQRTRATICSGLSAGLVSKSPVL